MILLSRPHILRLHGKRSTLTLDYSISTHAYVFLFYSPHIELHSIFFVKFLKYKAKYEASQRKPAYLDALESSNVPAAAEPGMLANCPVDTETID